MTEDGTTHTAAPSRDDVQKVAKLARLKLSEDEVDLFTTQLGQILEYVHIMDQLETDDVEPMAHAIEVSNVFREDSPKDSLPREAALANAPKSDGQSFLVPPILGGG
ncbi:MAG: Asp-tRNA(Asn)/Glu-tRNA(Gln) amidotransferase subunit GatC [Planctomycetaceae bacterium]|nr:Asp-tRNA(Asn)/Glu-tRNA(Gln) amidotransferase subunit GatC [Planctomycetaceae bacterium]